MAYWRRRRYSRTQGAGGLALGLAFIVLLGFYAMVVGVETTADVFDVLLGDGAIYDEEILQTYMEEQCAERFAEGSLEDQVMIVVLVDSEYEKYHYAVHVGSHIVPEVAGLYAGEDQKLGSLLSDCIDPGNYETTLNRDLTSVIKIMDNKVAYAKGDRLYTCTESHAGYRTLDNRTELKLGNRNMNRALGDSYIPTVILVEDMRDVYGYHVPLKELLIAITTLLSVAGIVLLVIRLFRRSSAGEEKPPKGGRRQEGTDYIEKLDDEHWEDRYESDFSQ